MNEKTPVNINQTGNTVGINPILVVFAVAILLLIIVGFYFYNVNSQILEDGKWLNVFYNRSQDNGDWGAFGDYVGGILNPVIALGALYLIAQTYKLQKNELEKTTELLKISTDAQDKQIKLAALTAILNSNMVRIESLLVRKQQVLNENPDLLPFKDMYKDDPETAIKLWSDMGLVKNKEIAIELLSINHHINTLNTENEHLQKNIKCFTGELDF